MKFIQAVALVFAIGWLAACSSTGDKKTGDMAVVEDRSGEAEVDAAAGDATATATATAVGGYSDLTIESLTDPNSPLSQRVIYFEFDSSEVSEQDREFVAAHAVILAANPNLKVSIEGHSDERGSREYNIGLGEKRAQSVRRMMELQGVLLSQMTTISYGEEKSALEGHDESAWSMNRRVELVYVAY
ncbi:MAG: peptidoglycan-associated lipoprotein Pal [Pseudomonadota bacterium]|nr:peptidoglycan-associated lipoprotein Pal [Pseudomonadota bacterium]